MKKMNWLIIVGLVALMLAGCAAGPNSMVDVPGPDGKVAGFWMGLWHGFASPVMFIISLFSDRVEVYEVHNTGGWYTFGFMIGVSAIFGGGGSGACKSGRRNRD